MSNVLRLFSDRSLIKNADKRCILIFPERWKPISGRLKSSIEHYFPVSCKNISYTNSSKSKISEISKALQIPCIIIVGYVGELSHELCYKLGLAHGHQKILILVKLEESGSSELDKRTEFERIPSYVRTNFFLSCDLDELPSFFEKIRNILNYLLSRDLARMFYRKAVDVCSSLERDSDCTIEKVDELLFTKLLYKNKKKSPVQKFTAVAYINDHEDLYWDLILLIAKDINQVNEALLSISTRFKNSPSSISRDVQPIIYNIFNQVNQYGRGDNVARDNYGGNKVV